eukprot:TRINITY_DN31816_c0_g3_i1.p1 TRINITY_DN31816_c0_g3~~TRINITY_DN31816_c0_g3_i1.p1  ORF type:complete len:401 (+),score=92.80 TRINITY_DN31816_c0_g3_i1:87-1205(+)
MVEQCLSVAGEAMQVATRLRKLFTMPQAGATARDAKAVAWLSDYVDSIVWQEDSVVVPKAPEDIVGVVWASPKHLVVQQVIENSAADRAKLQNFIGRRLTHVDSRAVQTVQHVRAFTKGKTELRLRFAAAAARGDRRSACLGCAAARRFGADPARGWAVSEREWAVLVRTVSGMDAGTQHFQSIVAAMPGATCLPCELLVPALCEGCGMEREELEEVLAAAVGFGSAGDRTRARQQLGQALGQRYQPGATTLTAAAFEQLCSDLGVVPQASDPAGGMWRAACRAAGVDPSEGIPTQQLVQTLALFPLQCQLPEAEASCCLLLLRALCKKLTAAATHPPPVHYPIFASRWGVFPPKQQKARQQQPGRHGRLAT